MLQFVQSPTHLSHITLSQPFRIKCERYIFLKKCVRWSLLLILFPHVYVYSCICIMWLYNSRGSYSSAEKQSVYSIAPADWAISFRG